MIQELRKLIENFQLWNISEDGVIDFKRHQFGTVRLLSIGRTIHGNQETLKTIIKVMDLIGANNYSYYISSDGNRWLDLNYQMTHEEIKEKKEKNYKNN